MMFPMTTTCCCQVMRKRDLIRKNLVENACFEKEIMSSANNAFIVRSYYSFTSKDNLYIVMEYISGGDTASLLRSMGALDESVARQYIAETVLVCIRLCAHVLLSMLPGQAGCIERQGDLNVYFSLQALEWCHQQGIIHRCAWDIVVSSSLLLVILIFGPGACQSNPAPLRLGRDVKPDNLLISASGHIKATDFGLSCIGVVDRADELVGELQIMYVAFNAHVASNSLCHAPLARCSRAS